MARRRPPSPRTPTWEKYGLTEEEYLAMVDAPGACCALCGQTWGHIVGGRKCRLHVDHDHETGLVRGLLCRDCNLGIGMLKNSPTLCRRAASYLEAAKRRQK